MAQGMSKDEYKSGKANLSSQYASEMTACGSMSGNAKDMCKVQASGKMKVARAELQANFEPSVNHHYAVRISKAEADYADAKEKCDDLTGNPKDVCVKEAKAAQVAAKADAKVQMKTTDARATASDKVNDARSDARSDKSDAQYKVEKEKCDALAGSAKDTCVTQAQTRFGK
jgi:hypothetical protein